MISKQETWRERWLKGEEYKEILDNSSLYIENEGIQVYSKKSHPSIIYSKPESRFPIFIQMECFILWKEAILALNSGSQESIRRSVIDGSFNTHSGRK